MKSFFVIIYLCLRATSASQFDAADGLLMTSGQKRQTMAQYQCAIEEFNAIFAGNTSSFVDRCRASLAEEISPSVFAAGGSTLQAVIDRLYEPFCVPDCGNVVLKAYDRCGILDVLPGGEEFLLDLCGTNENGQKCYRLYAEALDYIGDTGGVCYNNYQTTGTCSSTCTNSLADVAESQGCCVDAYHKLLSSSVDIDYYDLFSGCDVDRPGPCFNSPLTFSGAQQVATTIAMVVTSLGFYAIFG